MNIVATAKLIAELAHKGQDYSGEPYASSHLQMVVNILDHYGYSDRYLAAGWCHDLFEDTTVTPEQLAEVFDGQHEHIVELVEGCTGRGANRKERNADIYQKLKCKYPSAGIPKLADRMANLHTAIVECRPSFLQMYLKEDPEFRAALWIPTFEAAQWNDYVTMVATGEPLEWLAPNKLKFH